ncbi:MAG: radical SAM protein [Eggerthellaceae bacterium]|nr:radical SAM protein [Eggerthellaceae bacterium]
MEKPAEITAESPTEEKRPLHTTGALCPTCLKELRADVYADAAGAVWMERVCPEHGFLATRIWPDSAHYEWLRSLAFPKVAPRKASVAAAPCPSGCGVCTRHERRGTLLEIEVTQQCNLHCPVCFMSAADGEGDPTLEEIDAMYEAIAQAVGIDGAVQITGGEPTCRADLPEIIARGRAKGFWGIEVNTNGLVIASRAGYVERLAEAGLTGVYLSFDGLTKEVYQATCGADLLHTKLKAVERCREAGVQVVLAATIVSGLNDVQIGDLLRFALENADVVAGLALQPAFTSGRFEADRALPLTMGDVIFQLAEQSEGLLDVYDIWPLGCSHPLCDTGTFLVRGAVPSVPPSPGDKGTVPPSPPPSSPAPSAPAHPSGYYPATRNLTDAAYRAGYNPDSPQGSVFLDILAKQGIAGHDGLSLIIMNYMDAASMDTQRLRECSMMVAVPDGRTIPFCSYHLTDAAGRRVYPPWCKPQAQVAMKESKEQGESEGRGQ